MAKETFEIDVVMERVAEAVRPFPKAAMFELAAKGHNSPFEQLIGCILSIRTYDEVSLPVSLNLLRPRPHAAADRRNGCR
jgi:endonuclease-3